MIGYIVVGIHAEIYCWDGVVMEGVDSHKHLGVAVTEDDISVSEIINRIGKGKEVTRQLHTAF